MQDREREGEREKARGGDSQKIKSCSGSHRDPRRLLPGGDLSSPRRPSARTGSLSLSGGECVLRRGNRALSGEHRIDRSDRGGEGAATGSVNRMRARFFVCLFEMFSRFGVI